MSKELLDAQKTLFEENQSIFEYWRPTFLFLLVASSILITLTLGYDILLSEGTLFKNPSFSELIANMSFWLIICLGTFEVLIFCSLFQMKLTTRVSPNGVTVRFWPFKKKHYSWREIDSIYVRDYDARGEFGGWGRKSGGKDSLRNKSFTAKGTVGVQLKLKKGHNLLIGTQKPEKWKELLAQREYLGL